jgi:Polyketide cyclase / dehydrase and lipid transport
MIKVEYSDTFNYPASKIFAVLTDFQARSSWQPDIIETRLESDGTAQLGARVFEIRKHAGHRSENTLTINEFEQDRLLTLETVPGGKQRIREHCRIEPLEDGNCRLCYLIEIDGLPQIAVFFVRQTMMKQVPKNFELLKSVLASQAWK